MIDQTDTIGFLCVDTTIRVSISSAAPNGITRGSRCVPWPPGIQPSRISPRLTGGDQAKLPAASQPNKGGLHCLNARYPYFRHSPRRMSCFALSVEVCKCTIAHTGEFRILNRGSNPPQATVRNVHLSKLRLECPQLVQNLAKALSVTLLMGDCIRPNSLLKRAAQLKPAL